MGKHDCKSDLKSMKIIEKHMDRSNTYFLLFFLRHVKTEIYSYIKHNMALSIQIYKGVVSVLVCMCQLITQKREVIEHSNCAYTVICLW